MFCGCSTAYDGAPPNSHTCPVCLGSARRPADDQSTGRRGRPRDRCRRSAQRTPDGDPLGSQELLLSGPAQGLPDQPVRPAARRSRPADGRRPAPGRSRSGSPGLISRRTRPSSSTPPTTTAARSAWSTSTGPGPRSWRSSRTRTSGPRRRARRYAEELQLLLRTIGVSDADMERGQLRVEANVSLRRRGTEAFGTRVEVKNMNSFRSVERAIDVRDRAPGGGPRGRRDPHPGDPRLGRRHGLDLRHAVEGGLARLPLLPGAGPAAAPGRSGLAGGDPGRAPGAAGRAARALRRSRSGCRPTTRP